MRKYWSCFSGYSNRKLTQREEQDMLAILEKALQQGAAGLSLGMMYEPGLYADVEELKKVAALCVKYNKPLTVHPRAESKVSMSYPELFGCYGPSCRFGPCPEGRMSCGHPEERI